MTPDLYANVVVWGTYIETMQHALLPSLLAPGNLPALSQRVQFDIACPDSDRKQITAHPAHAALCQYADVRFISLDPTAHTTIHAALSAGQAPTLADAARDQAGVLVFSPDVAISDGALRAVEGYGAQAVLVASVRVRLEEGLRALAAGDFSPRTFARIILDHPHPVTQSLTVRVPFVSKWPSHLYWWVGDEGLLVRAFHLHPLYVRPDATLISDTIDGDYIERVCPNGAGVVIVDDSDVLQQIELSAPQHMRSTISPQIITRSQITAWTIKNTTATQRENARQSVRIHVGAMTPERWDAAEQRAMTFMGDIGL